MQESDNNEKPLCGLLARYTHLKRPDETVRVAVSKAIWSVVGVSVPVESISVRNGVVYISSHSTLKSEMAIHQKKIIEELKTLLKEDVPIRVI